MNDCDKDDLITCILVVSIFSLVLYGTYMLHNYKQEKLDSVVRQVYDLGKVAAQKDIPILANPYDKAKYPQEHGIWYKGFVNAKN